MSGREGRRNVSRSVQLGCPEAKGPSQIKQVVNICELFPTPLLSDSSRVRSERAFLELDRGSRTIPSSPAFISGLLLELHQKDEESKTLHYQDNRFLEGKTV